MKLKLIRHKNNDECTLGELYIDDKLECVTLEPAQGQGKGAIPEGIYPLTLDYSFRFKRIMPHIQNVKGFSGIRIHTGNTAQDTEGCILVGRDYNGNTITDSRKAFDPLFVVLQNTEFNRESIMIEIVSE